MVNKKVCAVIIAAGFSTRTKDKHKMMLKINNKTLIESCVTPFKSVCNEIILVTGHNRKNIETIFENDKAVTTVYNENFEKGMFSSVKKGVEQLNLNCDKFFFTPGDYPMYSTNLLKTMLNSNEDIVIPVFKNRKGHPVLINGKFKKQILSLSNNHSLRDFINSVNCSFLPIDEQSVLNDVDTLEDYKKVLQIYEK